MTRRAIRIIIALATVSIVGLVLTQLFWMDKAFQLREREFDDNVTAALRDVALEIKDINNDSTEVAPVQKLMRNYFIVSTTDTLHPYLLEGLLANEFRARNILTDFEYNIYDCFTDSLVFDGFVAISGRNYVRPKDVEIPRSDSDSHYFGVYFPDKQSYLAGQMGVWLVSSGVLLLVFAFFAYTLAVVLKQKRLSEIKSDFINNMTHEFKTPISTISASSDLLLSGAFDGNVEKQKRYFRMIRDESERLKLQVEKVLQMAQFDRSSIDLNLADTDLNEMIRKSTASVQLLLDERKGTIKLHMEAMQPVLAVDGLHFSNIIRNLLDNAVKYCSKEPRIVVSTYDDAKGITILVADNGIGIPPKLQREIFGKFYRVPTGSVHNVKGFGLGLYYVKSLTEAHGGKVSVESSAAGSTFRLWLPRKR
jgi:two-component system, OmpR family, phosphate regulon sensor histidine kinase PhoR